MPVTQLETWAIVELFGHQKIAGLITEETHAGVTMLRVDVPCVDGRQGFTRFYGGSAVYSITPTDEDTAIRAIVALQPRPITVFGVIVPERQIAAGLPDDEELYPDGWNSDDGFVEETEIDF